MIKRKHETAMKRPREEYEKRKRVSKSDNAVGEADQERLSGAGRQAEEPEEEMPLIRETIVRKFFWKEALFSVGSGILIAAVLGISIGIGVSYIAPLLRARHESVMGLDRLFGEAPSPTPTLPPLPETESSGEESSEPEGSLPIPSETDETGLRETPSETNPSNSETDPTDPSKDPGSVDPATLLPDESASTISKEELNALVESYLKDPSHREDQARIISDLMQDRARGLNKQFVSVRVTRKNTDRWFESPMEASQTVSSLIVEQETDYMLMITDYNSISQASSLTVSIGQKVLPATVANYDLITHLALLRVEIPPDVSQSIYHQMKPVSFGSSADLSVGEMVLAAGSPIGYAGSFSYGYVTYLGEYTNRWDAHYPAVYTDIISREQPFGFLFSLDGRAVGYIDRTSFGNSGIGSINALGAERLTALIRAMQQNKNFPYIGILGDNITDAMVLDQGLVKGIHINQTAQDSPAYLSALQAGDIITAIDGRSCVTMEQLMDQLSFHSPNDVVKVTYYRWSTGGGYQEMNTELILSGRFVIPESGT